MLYHSLVLVALSGILTPGSEGGPAWLKDYKAAQEQGKREKRPLALVFGSGADGWEKLSQEGALADDVKQLMAENYVCVYVDTEHIGGRRLAAQFEVTGGLGMVISDRTGHLQAFRHQGDLSHDRLAEYLQRYADPDRVVQVTESNPGTEETGSNPVSYPSFRSGGGC